MNDTLFVLATLGANRDLWKRALAAVALRARRDADALVVIDEATEADVAHLQECGYAVDASPVRRGLVGAYNVGFQCFLAHEEYRYLELLEEGVVVVEGWDRTLRAVLDAHPEFGWVACGQQENTKAPFTAYCSLLHRDAVEVVRGLDYRFQPAYFDDADLLMRLRAQGYEPHGIPLLISHPTSRTSRSWDDAYDAWLLLEKRLLFALLHGVADMDWSQVPVHQPCDRCRHAWTEAA